MKRTDNEAASSAPVIDRRRHNRFCCDADVSLFVHDAERNSYELQVAQVWLADISQSGAAIVTEEPISVDRFFLRPDVLGLPDDRLECVVRNRIVLDEFAGRSGTFHRHGVEFINLLSRDEFDAVVSDALLVRV